MGVYRTESSRIERTWSERGSGPNAATLRHCPISRPSSLIAAPASMAISSSNPIMAALPDWVVAHHTALATVGLLVFLFIYQAFLYPLYFSKLRHLPGPPFGCVALSIRADWTLIASLTRPVWTAPGDSRPRGGSPAVGMDRKIRWQGA